MNTALIVLGSNMPEGIENIAHSIEIINDKVISGRFSSIYETEPEGIHTHSRYNNCVGEITTSLSLEELNDFFKCMEGDFGRTMATRATGHVPLDLDIVIWNGQVVRPKDLARNYIKRGLGELNISGK